MVDQTNGDRYRLCFYVATDGDIPDEDCKAYLNEKLPIMFPVMQQSKVRFAIVFELKESKWIKIRSDGELLTELYRMQEHNYRVDVKTIGRILIL